jgi:hypothetical protein
MAVTVLLAYAVFVTVAAVALLSRSNRASEHELATVEQRLTEATIARLFPEDRAVRDIHPYRITVTWPKDYHGRVNIPSPLISDDFDKYRYGLNPPLLPLDDKAWEGRWDQWNDGIRWEHFEGVNVLGSEGLSNLYVTGWWAASLPKSLRARTGIARSARVNALDVWDFVQEHERIYYQCWLHVKSGPKDAVNVGFVADDPLSSEETNWSHAWTNTLALGSDGAVRWTYWDQQARRNAQHELRTWRPGAEEAWFLRVELDFNPDAPKGFVWINGEAIGRDLPISPKGFKRDGWQTKEFRLDRWAFTSPGTPEAEGLTKYEPRYTDIDDLEFGAWEYGPAETQPAGQAPVP